MKKIIALIIAILMIVPFAVSCSTTIKGENATVGTQLYMYLADEVYDFDPINAYTNDSTLKLATLMFEPLFKLNSKGKVVKDGLVKSYQIIENEKENEYKMLLTLKDTYWSDGTYISASDIVYSWKRIMEVDSSSPAASLLYDIQNARAVKAGEKSIDYLGIFDVEELKLEIVFEGKIDYDQFLVNLTSYCLCPIREDIVTKSKDTEGKTEDWAKKASTIACSGPFTLRESYYSPSKTKNQASGIILERNAYYMRDQLTDQYDKYVNISRIYVDWSLSEDEIIDAYNEGKIVYIDDIPLSYREELKSKADISDSLSTNSLYLNTAKEPFNNVYVRQAISMAIDRTALAEAVVYATPASGLVPNGVFNTTKGTSFRKSGETLLNSTADLSEAKELLKKANINASDFHSFKVTYNAKDAAHAAIAKSVVSAISSLGFKVTADPISAKTNDDTLKSTQEVAKDICDDIFNEKFTSGDFDIILFDFVAYSANAFQMLAQFAPEFSGEAMDMTNTDKDSGNPTYTVSTHITGYNSEEYNELINAIYFLPYYETINSNTSYKEFGFFESDEAFRANLAKVKAIYEKYSINTSFKNYKDGIAKLLHEAEKILMNDLPVIPLLQNQTAVITAKGLKNVKSDYYGNKNFNSVKLSGADKYMKKYELGKYEPQDEE